LSSLNSQITTITQAANGNWANFETIAVGNELVFRGEATVAQVVAAVGTTRTNLRAAGYTGSVVTVDTIATIRANPSLCTTSDYCAVNVHPFYNGVAASAAGSTIKSQVTALQSVVGTAKSIVITETGWPTQGNAVGNAVPSVANQKTAITSIKNAFSSSVIFYSAFDTLWAAPGEQHWGILGH